MPKTYDYLKALFGTDESGNPKALTFDQLVEKLGASNDINLVNLAEGGYVSKDKFDAKETELTAVKGQLTDANKAIQSYKDMDIEGIKKSAKDWEEKYNADTAALNQKLADQERAHNEDMFLEGYKFTSVAAKNGIKSIFKEKKFPYENGQFLGAKDYMELLKKDADYQGAFVVDAPADPPAPPADPQKTPPQFSSSKPNPPQPKPKKSLAELMKMKNDNPNAEINFD